MKRILIALLALVLLLGLAACGKTPPPVEETTQKITEILATAAPEETTDDEEETITVPGEETTEAKIPETKEELVEYFNEVVNRVKAEKPGFTWTIQNTVANIKSSSGFIESAAGMAMRYVPLDVQPGGPVAKGADHNADFNVRGQAWSSRLAPQAVAKATLTDKGKTWELRVDLRPEKRDALPVNSSDHDHGKVFSVFTHSSIHDAVDPYSWLATMNSFAPSYHSSWAKLTIDKETDRLLKAEYMLTMDAAIGAKFSIFPAFGATCTVSEHNVYTFG